MSPVLRPARPDDDLDAIMALERASFPSDAWSATAMASDLASEHTVYLVIEGVAGDPAPTVGSVDDTAAAGQLLGYGGILAPQGSGDADVQTIALDPALRGQGWGRRLMLALAVAAGERRARELFLEVRADNPVAHGLYTRLGFEEIGVRPRYYQPDGVDAVIMRAAVPALCRAAAEEDPR